jgi:hypothetical protein
VSHQRFFKILKNDKAILVDFIAKMAQAINVISEAGLVHSAIRPDNIFVKLEPKKNQILSLQLHGFHHSFKFDKIEINLEDPEYLAPELL